MPKIQSCPIGLGTLTAFVPGMALCKMSNSNSWATILAFLHFGIYPRARNCSGTRATNSFNKISNIKRLNKCRALLAARHRFVHASPCVNYFPNRHLPFGRLVDNVKWSKEFGKQNIVRKKPCELVCFPVARAKMSICPSRGRLPNSNSCSDLPRLRRCKPRQGSASCACRRTS